MSEIHITRPHRLSLQQARALTEQVAVRLHQQFDLRYRWEGNALHFEREGVQGAMTVAAREVRIVASLGFLLSLLQERIEQEIEAHLEQTFGVQESKLRRRTRRGPANDA